MSDMCSHVPTCEEEKTMRFVRYHIRYVVFVCWLPSMLHTAVYLRHDDLVYKNYTGVLSLVVVLRFVQASLAGETRFILPSRRHTSDACADV